MTSIEHTEGYYLLLVQNKKHTKQASCFYISLHYRYTFDT